MLKKLFLIFLLPLCLQGQEKWSDSIKTVLKNAGHDTTRCNILNTLIELEDKEEVWSRYNTELKNIAENNLKKKLTREERRVFTKHLAGALNNVGVLYNLKSDSKNAQKYYEEGLKRYIECNEKQGIAVSYNNLAYISQHNGDLKEAIRYYSSSLKIWEELNNLEGLSFVLNNLGFISKELGDLDGALKYYKKCRDIRVKLGYKKGLATVIHNIGAVYLGKEEFDSTLTYFYTALKIKQEIADVRAIGDTWHMLGGVFENKHFKGFNLDSSLIYYKRGLVCREKVQDYKAVAYSLTNLGNVYYKLGDYKKAKEYLTKALDLSKRLGFPDNIWDAAKPLSKLNEMSGDYKAAFENYQLYITMRDSLDNVENAKAAIKQQTEHDYEQKKAVADAENKARLKLQEETARAEKNRQRIIIASVSVVLLLVLVFSVFLYNRFKVTQKQKEIIEIKEKQTHEQKLIIEEKHKEITDSINYAERIQRSFLATRDLLDEHLGEYFILFKPKDVVSGDFYWASKLNNGNFALVTADSTGHGVPGAIMSLLNITGLEKAIETESSPEKILNLTRTTIIDRLKKDGSKDGGKDGMDCSLISFNRDKTRLEIAAAHNPVWVMRGEEVIEIKADKMPVGKHDRDQESFTLQVVELVKGDVVYALTDGFPDQFGGEKGKKFMAKKLRELLQSNSHKPMAEQKQILEQTFTEWVGRLEQIDDVTLVGIRI